MYILQYKIADLCFDVRSDFAISNSECWKRFSHRSDICDFLYSCHMHEALPCGEHFRRYYDSVREREYAATEELPGRMLIHLSRENLPWGNDINQLYPQFALPHILIQRQRLLLHASYIHTQKGAIVFTAPSGTGKSTQAELWKKHRGATIINGDRAVVCIQNGVAMAHGFPMSGSSSDCLNQSGKLLAIVSLVQASENKVRKLSTREALTVLINGSYLPPEYREDLAQVIDVALPIVQKIPVLELSCLPDQGAVDALSDALL